MFMGTTYLKRITLIIVHIYRQTLELISSLILNGVFVGNNYEKSNLIKHFK